MAFLGLMWVREHEAVVADLEATHTGRVANLQRGIEDGREAVLHLAKRNETLAQEVYACRAELATLKAERDDYQVQKDEGATYVLHSLADALHVEDWSIKDGSEEWEGDVFATMFSILVDAGVVEEDHHTVATHAKIIGLERAISSLTPDALKYRERLRRDREALAAKRKRNAPAVRLTPAVAPKAQAARGGDVREGV